MKRVATALLLLAVAAPSARADWLEAASLPGQGRHHPVNFVLDGYGYAATGTAGAATYTDDVYRYDPIADSWEILPDFPGTDRSYGYGGTYNGKGYLGFGTSPAYLNDLWEYDPVSEEWTQLASLPGQGRAHPAFVITDDGKIFVGMGNWTQNLRDWWEYDIAGNAWTQRTDLPGPARHHPYYFNIGDTPYVCFGHGAAIYDTVYRWNRDTNTWTQMTTFPGEGRVAGTQFSYGGKGYALSGEGEAHLQFPTGEFWEYDPSDDSWRELPPHPGSGRWAPGSFLIDGALYVMAGLSTQGLELDMWKFDMSGASAAGNPALAGGGPFVVYPNPVTGGRFNLLDPVSGRTPSGEIVSLRLIDVDGRQVARTSDPSGRVDIPRLPSGRYFLSLSMADGTKQTRPIMVIR